MAAFAAFGGFLFLNTLYLQDVRGLSPVQAGPGHRADGASMTVVASPLSGRIVGRRGARLPLRDRRRLPWWSRARMLSRHRARPPPSRWLFAAYVVFGLGFGFVNAPITNAAVSGMPRAQAGVAAAIATTSRQFGQTLGVAVVGAIAARARPSRSAGARPVVGEPPGWWTLAGCGAVVLVARPRWRPRGGPPQSARADGRELNPEALERQDQ